MPKSSPCAFLFVWVVALAPFFSRAEDPAKPTTPAKKTVRLLTIGNSFSNNATNFLDDIAAADGNLLIQKGAVVGGSPLQLHWERAQLHEQDPSDVKGTYTKGEGLKELLLAEPYDFITIQQASIKSHDLNTYRPYAAHLRQYTKKYAPQAELLLHETWAYRVDDPRFKVAKPKAGEPQNQREMYDQLHTSYKTIAGELGIRMIPVGTAFIAVDEDPTWRYQPDASFDPKRAIAPALPDQTHSLHTGWSWKKPTQPAAKSPMTPAEVAAATDEPSSGGVATLPKTAVPKTNAAKSTTANTTAPTLAMDGHHANVAGQYLGACVWYEVLFDRTCVGNTFKPKGLDEAFRLHLQKVAHETVAKTKAK